ncbi:hypothetical protein [Thermococcus sp.]
MGRYLTVFLTALVLNLPFTLAGHYIIDDAYSTGDRVMFIVEENGSRMAFLYNGSIAEREFLNFGGSYHPLHWNGDFWILKRGNRNVTLALYNGSLKILAEFKNGTLCNDNLFLSWNGEKYMVQFIQGPSRCGLGTGGMERSELYLIRGGRLYYLAEFDGSVSVYWFQNRWFIIGDGGILYTVEEHSLRKIGDVTGRASFVSDGKKLWVLTAERIFNASGLEYRITVYSLKASHLERIFSKKVDGIVGIPQYWKGNPAFILQKNGYYWLMVFNKTSGDFSGIRICKGDYLHIIPNGNSILAICGRLSREKAAKNRWYIFRIAGRVLRNVTVMRSREWPYIYEKDAILGFPALGVENGTFLIVSGFAFNTSTVVNLLTGKQVVLPGDIRGKNYRIVPYRNGWILFTSAEAYLMNNTGFVKIVLERHENVELASKNSPQDKKMFVPFVLFAVVLVFILQWRLRK